MNGRRALWWLGHHPLVRSAVRLLDRHGDAESLVRADVVVGVGGIVTEVDLDPFDSPGEVAGLGPDVVAHRSAGVIPEVGGFVRGESIGWVASTRPSSMGGGSA